MKNGTKTEVYYYHGDHLGSTSVVTRKGRLFAGTRSVNSNWTSVSLNEWLVKPVVIAKLMTENDEDNSVERITTYLTYDQWKNLYDNYHTLDAIYAFLSPVSNSNIPVNELMARLQVEKTPSGTYYKDRVTGAYFNSNLKWAPPSWVDRGYNPDTGRWGSNPTSGEPNYGKN